LRQISMLVQQAHIAYIAPPLMHVNEFSRIVNRAHDARCIAIKTLRLFLHVTPATDDKLLTLWPTTGAPPRRSGCEHRRMFIRPHIRLTQSGERAEPEMPRHAL